MTTLFLLRHYLFLIFFPFLKNKPKREKWDVSILSKFHPELPGNSQVYLAHYKKGCLTPSPSLVLLLSVALLLLSSSPLPIPLPPFSTWSWPASTSLLSPSLCLYYPNSPPHALKKLCSTLYHRVAGPSGERDALAWARCGTPSPIPHHTSIEHIL